MKQITLFALLALSACTTAPDRDYANGPTAPLNEVANLEGLTVTPLAVIEDSRCPTSVKCIWAGRVRISALISLRGGSEELRRELILGEAVTLPEGTLTLVDVRPGKRALPAITPRDYRFTFRFQCS